MGVHGHIFEAYVDFGEWYQTMLKNEGDVSSEEPPEYKEVLFEIQCLWSQRSLCTAQVP